jgi:tryptophanyl-tRNA synthetase
MTRVLSGVQPTGNLHIGNYLGAIKNWVAMQHQHESLFCIVDLHAITVPQDPKLLREATLTTAAAYIACGIEPEKSIIFHQSAVPEHSELAWLFSAITPMGWLNRMTQFKEKAGEDREKSCLGLYAYPVLMAADILLYHTTHVPVGEDQKQHLELARDIAGAFNRQYKKQTQKPYFRLPEPMILGAATRVMSLRDGTKKMSKSEESDYSRINLTDNADTIMQKIKKAKSDMEPGISYDAEKRPEISNLINIFAAVTGERREPIVERFINSGMAEFKTELADSIIAHLAPITKKLLELQQDRDYLEGVMMNGAAKAREIAGANIKEIKKIMGFLQG